jgi:hypothetical protein
MSYTNPLYHTSSTRAGYPALTGPMNDNPTPSQFISPFRRRIPQKPFTPASKWRVTRGLGTLLQDRIIFDYVGHSKQGISIVEASARGVPYVAQAIKDPNDLVLAQTGLSRIMFRIIVSALFRFLMILKTVFSFFQFAVAWI